MLLAIGIGTNIHTTLARYLKPSLIKCDLTSRCADRIDDLLICTSRVGCRPFAMQKQQGMNATGAIIYSQPDTMHKI